MASTSRNGSPSDSKALVCEPRHSPPAATTALMARRHHVGRFLIRAQALVAEHDPVQPGDRVDGHRAELVPEALHAGGARAPHQPGGSMEHLAQRDAAQRRVDEVVQRRMVGLAVVLPGGAAEGRHRRRLVEAQPVGAPGGVVVAALIGVADLVDREVVEIPDPALLHVCPPGLRGDLGGDLAARQVGQLVEPVDDGGLDQRLGDAALRTSGTGAALVLPRRRRGGRLQRRLVLQLRQRRRDRARTDQRFGRRRDGCRRRPAGSAGRSRALSSSAQTPIAATVTLVIGPRGAHPLERAGKRLDDITRACVRATAKAWRAPARGMPWRPAQCDGRAWRHRAGVDRRCEHT